VKVRDGLVAAPAREPAEKPVGVPVVDGELVLPRRALADSADTALIVEDVLVFVLRDPVQGQQPTVARGGLHQTPLITILAEHGLGARFHWPVIVL